MRREFNPRPRHHKKTSLIKGRFLTRIECTNILFSCPPLDSFQTIQRKNTEFTSIFIFGAGEGNLPSPRLGYRGGCALIPPRGISRRPFDSPTYKQSNNKTPRSRCFIVGAGEGNRTPLSRLETCGNNHYTTPALFITRLYGRSDLAKRDNLLISTFLVGATGLEPATSWSQTRRSSHLSYTPPGKCLCPPS